MVAQDIGQLLYTLDSIFIRGKESDPHQSFSTNFKQTRAVWGLVILDMACPFLKLGANPRLATFM